MAHQRLKSGLTNRDIIWWDLILKKRAVEEKNSLLKSQDEQRNYILSRVSTNNGIPLLSPELLELWNGEL